MFIYSTTLAIKLKSENVNVGVRFLIISENCGKAEGAEWQIVNWHIIDDTSKIPKSIKSILNLIELQIEELATNYMDEWLNSLAEKDEG